jgi:hypothetical protein
VAKDNGRTNGLKKTAETFRRRISAECGITQQELTREAFNLLFEKYGKARIA